MRKIKSRTVSMRKRQIREERNGVRKKEVKNGA
jgi:hypothetical protein